MIRLLSLLSIAIFFPSAVSAENDDAIAIDEKTAIDLNYSVDVYECDNELFGLKENQKKKHASVYRICFEPNQIAKDAGVAIKGFDSWIWSSSHKNGEAVQNAVVEGKGVSGLSILECLDEGNKCFLDTFLSTDFYDNAGSVLGEGEASMTAGTGNVPVALNLFQSSFSMTFKNPDGETMTDEETSELMKKVDEHNDAREVHNDEDNKDEDAKAAEDVKEEL